MFSESTNAIFSAMRLLLKNRRALALMIGAYVGLLAAIYLFVSTREATISQLVLSLMLVIAAPALFFVLQALSVSYTNGCLSRKVSSDCLKLVIVSLPVIAVTLLAVYGLNKIQTNLTVVTAARYLLIGVVAPLFAIQLWVTTSSSGLRSLAGTFKKVFVRTFAPQSVFVYTCGFMVFAVVPYFLLSKTMPSQRVWLEFSLLTVRLSASALLILLGWVTTVGAISILNRSSYHVN